ncbi:MAG: LytTR family DNA-binding domain-containing protein [Reichenbachiella sp.]|uniref:LytR/AlgR family response regulator transcription factor n=1 Tax=Reichenbachiella sp. TaxID=2184521 RepID=UPI002966DCA6|nr:LytTR family DNA-binding domain-containing protein [Reichenbachiella sp.]MDW3211780.1 LytTR family DNA-binding domain-containing protein [Reichenbachiella sp.]
MKGQSQLINFIQFMHLKYQGFVLYAFAMVLFLVLFESAQQYYFILQFDLAPTDEFSVFDLAIAHAYRWMIWLSITLIYCGAIIYTGKSNKVFNLTKAWPAVSHLIILIVINVLAISLIQLVLNNRALTLENIWDNCVFFFYQKTPIYTLAHVAILGLFHLVNVNQNLAIEILDLKNKIKKEDTQALSIKIGNKNKIIPLSDILWIEAYDYCVKIHTVSQHTYAMRNSLKALEKKLQDQQFLRVHRKAIVNMKKVSEVSFNSSSFLTLENHTKIDVSQSRVRDVKTFYG